MQQDSIFFERVRCIFVHSSHIYNARADLSLPVKEKLPFLACVLLIRIAFAISVQSRGVQVTRSTGALEATKSKHHRDMLLNS